jgi:hypothetical protein
MSWDATYSDVALVDLKSGQRQPILQHWRGTPAMSPGGRFLLYFDEAEADWFTYRIADGAKVNLTAKLKLNFWREDHDTPNLPPAYGSAGWTKNDATILLYDKYDIWEVKPDGSGARMITGGHGRQTQTVFRYRSLDPEERTIPTDKPLLLSANDDTTESSGFYRVPYAGTAAPEKIVMLDKAFGPVVKAKNADRVVFTQARFDEFPDLWVSDTSFRDMKKVSNANPQQSEYAWGKTELMRYINADGKTLRAIIAKPENFDPSKKYPLMVYIYEELSEGLHSYRAPAPGTSINITRYVSNGYVVLMPDIVYETGYPGESAEKCVIPAVNTVVAQGFIDPKRIGIQGHSWGGEDPEPHRAAAVGRAAAVHRELAHLLGGEGPHPVPLDPQRRGRCGAVVSGDRVLLGDAPAGEASLHVRLQRRAARPAPARQHEALDRAPGRVLRSLPAREAEAGMDGEGGPLSGARTPDRGRPLQAEGDDDTDGAGQITSAFDDHVTDTPHPPSPLGRLAAALCDRRFRRVRSRGGGGHDARARRGATRADGPRDRGAAAHVPCGVRTQ